MLEKFAVVQRERSEEILQKQGNVPENGYHRTGMPIKIHSPSALKKKNTGRWASKKKKKTSKGAKIFGAMIFSNLVKQYDVVNGIEQSIAGIYIGYSVRGNLSTAAAEARKLLGKSIVSSFVVAMEENSDYNDRSSRTVLKQKSDF